jgi:hypothetical protein
VYLPDVVAGRFLPNSVSHLLKKGVLMSDYVLNLVGQGVLHAWGSMVNYLGWGGIVAVAAGLVLLLSLTGRIVKSLCSRRGLLFTGLLLVAALCCMRWGTSKGTLRSLFGGEQAGTLAELEPSADADYAMSEVTTPDSSASMLADGGSLPFQSMMSPMGGGGGSGLSFSSPQVTIPHIPSPGRPGSLQHFVKPQASHSSTATRNNASSSRPAAARPGQAASVGGRMGSQPQTARSAASSSKVGQPSSITNRMAAMPTNRSFGTNGSQAAGITNRMGTMPSGGFPANRVAQMTPAQQKHAADWAAFNRMQADNAMLNMHMGQMWQQHQASGMHVGGVGVHPIGGHAMGGHPGHHR